jgi:Ca2+-binding EF-hand superfamily protein
MLDRPILTAVPFATLCALALAMALPALAEDPAAGAAPIVNFDLNGDGQLSPPELEAAQKAREAMIVKQWDADGDGVLSDAERAAGENERQKARDTGKQARLESLDSDGDGEISQAERRAGVKKREAERKAQIQRYDTDDDGRLNGSERDALSVDQAVEASRRK